MDETTKIMMPDLTDLDEQKKLEQEALKRLIESKQLKSLPDMPDSSIMSMDLPDSNPTGTKTLQRSTSMADQEAIDFIKNKLNPKQLPETPSFLNVDPDAKSLHKSSNMASQEAIDYANRQRMIGKLKNIVKPIGKAAGVALGLGTELAFAEELGPAAGSDDEIIENPSLPLEVRKAALMRMKNKYLKPQE